MKHRLVRTIAFITHGLPGPRFTLAAMVLALIGALGQPCFAAEPPAGLAGLNQSGQPDCRLCIVGTASVQFDGSRGSFHVDQVVNNSRRGFSGLALQVQLQSTYPDPGDFGVGEFELSDLVRLGALPPGGSHTDIDSGLIAFDGGRVPAGEYYMLVMLLADLGSEWPYFTDYVVMDEKVTCDGSSCAMDTCARVAGEWGFTWTGTFMLPTGPTPVAGSGTFTIDATGELSGRQISSVGGVVEEDTLNGSAVVDRDCRGTLEVGLYDAAGTLLRSAVWGLVLVDNGRELRGIFRSLVLPNGALVRTIATAEGRRLRGMSAPATGTVR